jgi:chemotaxis family two-component system sensor kinase Cph1
MSTEMEPLGVDLTNCDRESIHIPGAIQPHGVLLALREPELTIMQVSENVGDHVQLSPDALLGGPLSLLLFPACVDLVKEALADGRWERVNPLRLEVRGKQFDGILHRHDGALILELEPLSIAVLPQSVHHPLRAALMSLQSARGLPALYETVVGEVKRLTGFERVLLYRFDPDGHGSVDAEARDASLEPYLGLHYPASDIPKQARELYLRNWLRIIPDARYTPVRLVPPLRPQTGTPLDLSFSVLRSVSPVHLEYLANMGIRASMSISLLVRDRLWGLIGCANHSGPRRIPYEIRSASEVLGRLASLQIAALEGREAAERRASNRTRQEALAEALRGGSGFDSLLERPKELLALVTAGGATVLWDGKQQSCGRTPPPELIASLAEWVEEQTGLVPFATASLPALFPPALDAKETASGLLTFALPGKPRRRLLWFRPEVLSTIHWGGDPNKPVVTDPHMRIHPRRSFDLWKEEVRLQSARWAAGDIEAAEDLRRSAVEIDLEHQVLREQRAVRARDDLVAVVSHDLRNPLGVIQMQATTLLRTAGPSDPEFSRRLRTSAEHIQRSVDRMNTLIRDLLDLAKLEAGRFTLQRHPQQVGEMIEEALLILRPLADAKRITLTAAPREAQVNADRDRIFQVLSNLVGNAIKFTPAGGSVNLECDTRAGEVLVTVSDTGPGIPAHMMVNVFDRYWQARSGDQQGTGLGLFIAKGIVEAHGGRIWAEARAEPGATFTFTLPMVERAPS